MRTTAELRKLWAPPCAPSPAAAFGFWSGVSVIVDARILDALAALDEVLHRWSYRPRGGQTFGYACRRITGGTGYSLHAFGIAVDINSLTNPYGDRLVTDMPAGMVAEIKAIRTRGGLAVWRWGGDFGGPWDAMHFEIVASPSELAAGITRDEEDDMTDAERAQLATAAAKANDAVNYCVDLQSRMVGLRMVVDDLAHKLDELLARTGS